jgi:hypothetical protein
MTLFVQNDTGGAGTGKVFPLSAQADLFAISNSDGKIGQGPIGVPADLIPVTYGTPPDQTGTCPTRLQLLVNTKFTDVPADPIDIIILATDNGFTLVDGTLLSNFGGLTMAPAQKDSTGTRINPTNSVLVVYDTSQGGGTGYCAKGQVSGKYDLQSPNPVILYHELSHALRTATKASLSTTASGCAASPEEAAAETDENDMRDQLGIPHRDTTDHCVQPCTGGSTVNCCIIASVATGSYSAELNQLRQVRDGFLRKSDTGFDFFERLHHDYYAFSPQVVTMMGNNPVLVDRIRSLFVKPLTDSLQLIYDYLVCSAGTSQLGRSFLTGVAESETLSHLTDTDIAVATRLLGRPQLGAAPADDTETDGAGLLDLLDLLSRTAFESEYVVWALIGPIDMYLQALSDRLDRLAGDEIGARFADRVDEWASRMPITPLWSTMSGYAIGLELDFLKETILSAAESRSVFARRLLERFPDDRRLLPLLLKAGYLLEV